MTTMYKRRIFRYRGESKISYLSRKAWEYGKYLFLWLLMSGLVLSIEWMIVKSI